MNTVRERLAKWFWLQDGWNCTWEETLTLPLYTVRHGREKAFAKADVLLSSGILGARGKQRTPGTVEVCAHIIPKAVTHLKGRCFRTLDKVKNCLQPSCPIRQEPKP